jgi:hypothetical protein
MRRSRTLRNSYVTATVFARGLSAFSAFASESAGSDKKAGICAGLDYYNAAVA